jgi:heme exporter protein A
VTGLRVENLSKRFGSRVVLRNVCAEVCAGETLVVTGHNGSGKSTLLSAIAGLVRTDAGCTRFLIDDHELSADERRREIGLVAPDLNLYAELAALENLEFFARLRSLPRERKEMEGLLERVGLAGRGRDLVGGFSSGMRVRLKYAVALHARPTFLLLDEPTAMLDESGVRLVESIIAEQRQRGVLVLATNDPREERHADLVLSMMWTEAA